MKRFPADYSGPVRPRRWLLVSLIATLLIALSALAPRASQVYHTWKLRRMPPARLRGYLKTHPSDLDAAYRLGMDDAGAGEYADAGRLLLSVFQRDPSRVDVLNDYAVILIAQRRYTEAFQALSGLVKSADPDNSQAWANLGRLHLLVKMPFTATKDLQRAVQLDPGNLNVLRDLGTAQQQTLNFSAARETFQAALRRDPSDAESGVGLAQAYEALAQPSEAMRVIKNTLRIHPKNPDALSTLGDLQLKQAQTPQEFEESLKPLRSAAALNPTQPPVLFNIGMALRSLHRDSEAVAPLTQALRLSPDDDAALYQLSQALIASGQRVEGMRLGDLYRLRASRKKLEEAMNGRTARNPLDSDAHLQLAQLYLDERLFDEAAAQCDQVLTADPNNRPARRLLVRAALAQQFGGALIPPASAPHSPSNIPASENHG